MYISKNKFYTIIACVISILAAIVFRTQQYTIGLLILLIAIFLVIRLSQSHRLYLVYTMILLDNCFFYLLPSKIGSFQVSKLQIVVTIGAFIALFWKKRSIKLKFTKITGVIGFSLIIFFTSSLAAYLKVGQSIIWSMISQAEFLSLMMLIPLLTYGHLDLDEIENLSRVICNIAIIEALVLLVQYLLGNSYVFLSAVSISTRNGLRVNANVTIMVLAYIILFRKILEKPRIIDIIKIGLILVVQVIVIQTRMMLLGLAVATIVLVIISNKRKSIKAIALFLPILLIALLATRNQIFNLLYLTANEISDLSSGNLAIRLDEYSFYISQIDHSLIGRGFLTAKVAGADRYITYLGNYDVSDIGILGMYIIYGVLGVAWVFWIWIKLFKDSLKYNKFSVRRNILTAYIAYMLVTSVTLLDFYYSPVILIILILVAASPVLKLEKEKIRGY